ncbi:MAG: hypothetical protein HY880_04130 [Deltaproteobacteria bacterium]|nr:hypothetical protein [Deltaproteobacteria bacterium]
MEYLDLVLEVANLRKTLDALCYELEYTYVPSKDKVIYNGGCGTCIGFEEKTCKKYIGTPMISCKDWKGE